jgi:pimeloyl-ACP methyl ester carboxylesterase
VIHSVEHEVDNGQGWRLSLFQTWDDERLQPARRPVFIVPGYGMNSFIYSYHPRGRSFEGYLVHAGFEVWRVDMRAQGRARSTGGSAEDFQIGDLALVDLPVSIAAALSLTKTRAADAQKIDVVGPSLGGTIALTWAVLDEKARTQLASLVLMGAPICWVKVHPLVKILFGSPMIAGLVKLKNSRRVLERVVPMLARHTPWILTFYMNPEISDTTAIRDLVRTVEDPTRNINRQISLWIKNRDLVIRGVNVVERLREIKNPLLCLFANGDGVVPKETASFAYHHVGSTDRQLIEVGTPDESHAHADMFISNEAAANVFEPISLWLAARSG